MNPVIPSPLHDIPDPHEGTGPENLTVSDTTVQGENVDDSVEQQVIEMTPEQALNALHAEHKVAIDHITQLEASNEQLKTTVLQLETQLNTGMLTFIYYFDLKQMEIILKF